MDETLICLVQRNEMLYNIENKFYNDINKKEEVWTQIGIQLNRPGARCKARWGNLRDQYRRALRNKKTTSGTLKKWKFEDDMAFLLPYFQEREAGLCPNDGNDTQSISASINSDDDVQIVAQEHKAQKKKRTGKSKYSSRKLRKDIMETQSATLINYIIQQKEREDSKINNADDCFFSSMAQTVKMFSPIYKNMAKRKIFEIVSNLEMEEIRNSTREQDAFNEKISNESISVSPFKEDAVMTLIKLSPRDINCD